jgi:hypothetical protein
MIFEGSFEGQLAGEHRQHFGDRRPDVVEGGIRIRS